MACTDHVRFAADAATETEAKPTPAPFPGMVWIPGGTFRMGSDKHYPEERPAHRVSVDGFWIDRYPVTNARFKRFVAETGYVTFAAESGRKLRWKSFFAFVVAGVLGLIGNTATLVIAADFMRVEAAKILAIGVGFLINFSMSHFVVFRPKKPGPKS